MSITTRAPRVNRKQANQSENKHSNPKFGTVKNFSNLKFPILGLVALPEDLGEPRISTVKGLFRVSKSQQDTTTALLYELGNEPITNRIEIDCFYLYHTKDGALLRPGDEYKYTDIEEPFQPTNPPEKHPIEFLNEEAA